MNEGELLQLWCGIHGELDEAKRARFLAKAEVTKLTQMSDRAVLAAMARSPRLANVLAMARAEGWWFEGQPCPEDDLIFCGRCKPHPYPKVVIVTRGFSATFHRSESCDALVEGQGKVMARGGEPAPVVPVAVQQALGEGRFPCLICFPTGT